MIARGLILACVVIPATAVLARPQSAPTVSVLPAVAAHLRAGDSLAGAQQPLAALAQYRQAQAAAPQPSALCRLRAGGVEESIADFDAAAQDFQQAIASATTAAMNADAQAQFAELLDDRAGYGYAAPEQEELWHRAEAHYDAALALAAGPAPAWHFRLALVLFRQWRDAEAIGEMMKALNAPHLPADVAAKARITIDHPELGRAPAAPPLALEDPTGQRVSSRAFAGKVAVLLFWGTWCPRCAAARAVMAASAAATAAPPESVAYIAISTDKDPAAWRKFLATHSNFAIEARDRSDQARLDFGIHEFPTFLVIDRAGLVRTRIDGLPSNAQANLIAATQARFAPKP